MAGLFKLFVVCSSWRILKHSLKHIFHCHLLRVFESFHDTSKTPTFTLLIKTNAQLHLKILSCNFYFLKNVTDFRHIILQPAGKFNPKFLLEDLIQNSFKEGVSSLQASLSCLTLFFCYSHSYSGLYTFLVHTASIKKIGRIIHI